MDKVFVCPVADRIGKVHKGVDLLDGRTLYDERCGERTNENEMESDSA